MDFFLVSVFYTKKSPRKKSTLIVKDAWEQLMFTTLEIKELDTINTPGYIQYAYVEIKKTFL